MASSLNPQNGQKKFQNFSVETVRNLLNVDNKGIAKLCAQVSMMPKKDQYGRTYFSKDDVEMLRRVKSLQSQTKQEKRSHVSVPVKAISPINTNKPIVNMPIQTSSTTAVDKICTSLASMEDNLTEKMSKLLDEKQFYDSLKNKGLSLDIQYQSSINTSKEMEQKIKTFKNAYIDDEDIVPVPIEKSIIKVTSDKSLGETRNLDSTKQNDKEA